MCQIMKHDYNASTYVIIIGATYCDVFQLWQIIQERFIVMPNHIYAPF